jgi:hypothetical protein
MAVWVESRQCDLKRLILKLVALPTSRARALVLHLDPSNGTDLPLELYTYNVNNFILVGSFLRQLPVNL